MPNSPLALISTAALLLLLGVACGAIEESSSEQPTPDPTTTPTDTLIRQPSTAPTINPAHQAKIDALLLSAYESAASQPSKLEALQSMSGLIELTIENNVATVGALISGTATPAELAAVDFVEQTRIGTIIAGHFPLLQLPALAALDSIDRIEASTINTLQAGN